MGVVRWISEDPANPGMGVQFVRLKSQVTGRKPLDEFIGPKEADQALRTFTRDAPARRFLRFYLRNLGNSYTVEELMDHMGLSRAMLEKVTADFVRWGLVRVQGPYSPGDEQTLMTLIPPENEQLERVLNTWLLEQEAQ